jgi:hypothetical protein
MSQSLEGGAARIASLTGDKFASKSSFAAWATPTLCQNPATAAQAIINLIGLIIDMFTSPRGSLRNES